MANREILDPDILRQLLDCDPQTGSLTWRQRAREFFPDERAWKLWNTRLAGKPAFRGLSNGYRTGSIFNVTYFAHRVIWALVHGEWPPAGMQIDHINGDRADNRLCNLRVVTLSENNRNRRRLRNNTSGFNGVGFAKGLGRWIAHVYLKTGPVYLGSYATKAEAIAARSAANFKYGFTTRHGS